MSEWDGRGLPPVAAERVRRAAEGGAWTSLLSAPATAGLEVAGFDPVGEVMGSMVQRIGWSSYFGCGATGWYGTNSRTITSSQKGGFGPYAQALQNGWGTAIGRMVTEASMIGADGIVGVRLMQNNLGNNAHEFTAIGTGVRARSQSRPLRVFSTHLPGQDVAKLVLAGWMPTDVVLGLSVGIRHDDWNTRQQSTWSAGNVEVTGYTELINVTRADARRLFARHVEATGADGAIIASMRLVTWEIEPSEGHTDHLAQATIIGTSIAQFHRSTAAPSRSLTYLPLRRSPS
ncbi:MAG: heavy metal-binding domain-containing protein [Pseudonocardiales bacterium]|nr:heavy metal-binding domain-containing protein [Pseudonocardiales bacterium]